MRPASSNDETAARLTRVYESDIEAAEDALAHQPEGGRSRRRTFVGVGVAVAAFGAVAVLAVVAVEPRPPGGLVTGGVATDAVAGTPTRDLSTVSNEEMEEVIAANPTVVPMRLALVERYLDAGELQKAHDHAEAALAQDPGTDDEARSLRYLEWTTALLGEPADGADLVQQSLDLVPENLDSLWFLANIRLEGLGDPAGAVPCSSASSPPTPSPTTPAHASSRPSTTPAPRRCRREAVLCRIGPSHGGRSDKEGAVVILGAVLTSRIGVDAGPSSRTSWARRRRRSTCRCSTATAPSPSRTCGATSSS